MCVVLLLNISPYLTDDIHLLAFAISHLQRMLPLFVSPPFGKYILNKLVCKFDLVENTFSLLFIYPDILIYTNHEEFISVLFYLLEWFCNLIEVICSPISHTRDLMYCLYCNENNWFNTVTPPCKDNGTFSFDMDISELISVLHKSKNPIMKCYALSCCRINMVYVSLSKI